MLAAAYRIRITEYHGTGARTCATVRSRVGPYRVCSDRNTAQSTEGSDDVQRLEHHFLGIIDLECNWLESTNESGTYVPRHLDNLATAYSQCKHPGRRAAIQGSNNLIVVVNMAPRLSKRQQREQEELLALASSKPSHASPSTDLPHESSEEEESVAPAKAGFAAVRPTPEADGCTS